MDFTTYIQAELLVLVPVLYAIGIFIKHTETIKNNYIPLILALIGLALSGLYVIGVNGVSVLGVFTAIVQGILCAAGAVFTNEMVKQLGIGGKDSADAE